MAFLEIKACLAPYDDGSGHRVGVEIRQENPGDIPTITLDSVFRLEVTEWPAIVAEIEHMMKALPDRS